MPQDGFARFIDRFTIAYERTYPHPIERVWQALTTPADISVWFWEARFELRVGAPYRFGPDDSDFTGVITVIEPPCLIRFGGPDPHGPEGYLEFRLDPVAQGTRLTFVQHSQPGFWRRDEWPIDPPDLAEGPGLPWRPGTLSGWHGSFDCLGDLLDGVQRDDFRSAEERRLQDVYRERLRAIPPA